MVHPYPHIVCIGFCMCIDHWLWRCGNQVDICVPISFRTAEAPTIFLSNLYGSLTRSYFSPTAYARANESTRVSIKNELDVRMAEQRVIALALENHALTPKTRAISSDIRQRIKLTNESINKYIESFDDFFIPISKQVETGAALSIRMLDVNNAVLLMLESARQGAISESENLNTALKHAVRVVLFGVVCVLIATSVLTVLVVL